MLENTAKTLDSQAVYMVFFKPWLYGPCPSSEKVEYLSKTKKEIFKGAPFHPARADQNSDIIDGTKVK